MHLILSSNCSWVFSVIWKLMKFVGYGYLSKEVSLYEEQRTHTDTLPQLNIILAWLLSHRK